MISNFAMHNCGMESSVALAAGWKTRLEKGDSSKVMHGSSQMLRKALPRKAHNLLSMRPSKKAK